MSSEAPSLNPAISWVERQLRGRVLHVRSLHGATSSDVYRLVLDGQPAAILRLFSNEEWLAVEPDLSNHEAAALQLVDPLPIPTPQLLAFDPQGSEAGVPAVLMGELPGVVDLIPDDLDSWLQELAAIPSVIGTAGVADFPWEYRVWQDLTTLQPPPWSARPKLWEQTIEAMRELAPANGARFLHRDFHPTNVLWSDGELTGVIDWVNACVGPGNLDVGHCRLDLALMYGQEVADRFSLWHERMTSELHHPMWDLLSVADRMPEPGIYEPWIEFGLIGLDEHTVRARFEEFTARALSEIN